MASGKRTSEGIALLSMYDDEDDEMEANDEVEENHDAMDVLPPPSSDTTGDDEDGVGSRGIQSTPGQRDERGLRENSSSGVSFTHATSTVVLSTFSLQKQEIALSDTNFVKIQRKSRSIVDYGHEEGIMSPEAEDSEHHANAQLIHGEHLEAIDGEFLEKISPVVVRDSTLRDQVTSPKVLDQINTESDTTHYPPNDLGSAETGDVVMVSGEEQKVVDLVEQFLSPPTATKCSDELQKKFVKFLSLRRDGRSFNSEVRIRKEYRNPLFLLHAMTYQNIEQFGSCFSKDVFDPHGYDKSDFFDEMETSMEMERKDQERKKGQKIDFASAGIQPVPTPKVPRPTPGSGAVGASKAPPANSIITSRDGRSNKKSKWDKVDSDSNNSLSTGGLENLSVGAAALVSAAKTGSGYSAFAQQRRKDAENMKSMDRKVERG